MFIQTNIKFKQHWQSVYCFSNRHVTHMAAFISNGCYLQTELFYEGNIH